MNNQEPQETIQKPQVPPGDSLVALNRSKQEAPSYLDKKDAVLRAIKGVGGLSRTNGAPIDAEKITDAAMQKGLADQLNAALLSKDNDKIQQILAVIEDTPVVA